METIEYPVDMENTLFAALSQPSFIDSRGNLYVLHDGGATVLVSGPETGSNIQFQGAGSSRQFSWAVTQERLFAYFYDGDHLSAPLPRGGDSIKLPMYRRSVLAVTSSSSGYLLHNTESALYCFAVEPNGISLLAKVDRHNGRGAWVENGNLYIFGMRMRVHRTGKSWFNPKSEWFTLKRGIGALLRIDLKTKRLHIDSAGDTKKALKAAWLADAGDTKARFVQPLLEAWVGSFETEQGRILIGAVADKRLSEWDDTFEEPNPLDFEGTAFYRWRDGKVELLRLLRGARYIGQMAGSDGLVLFFSDADNDFRDEDRYLVMRASPDVQSPLIPVRFDWVTDNLLTAQFEPSYDDRVGAIATATTQGHDIHHIPVIYRRHLAMSDDGITWRFVHQLPDQITVPQSSGAK